MPPPVPPGTPKPLPVLRDRCGDPGGAQPPMAARHRPARARPSWRPPGRSLGPLAAPPAASPLTAALGRLAASCRAVDVAGRTCSAVQADAPGPAPSMPRSDAEATPPIGRTIARASSGADRIPLGGWRWLTAPPPSAPRVGNRNAVGRRRESEPAAVTERRARVRASRLCVQPQLQSRPEAQGTVPPHRPSPRGHGALGEPGAPVSPGHRAYAPPGRRERLIDEQRAGRPACSARRFRVALKTQAPLPRTSGRHGPKSAACEQRARLVRHPRRRRPS